MNTDTTANGGAGGGGNSTTDVSGATSGRWVQIPVTLPQFPAAAVVVDSTINGSTKGLRYDIGRVAEPLIVFVKASTK